MLCALILYVSSGTYSLTLTPNDRFLETFTRQVYLLSEFLTEICWEAIAEEILFIYHFWWLTWVRTQAFATNKLTHYMLDHGDYMHFYGLKIPNVRCLKSFREGWRTYTSASSCRLCINMSVTYWALEADLFIWNFKITVIFWALLYCLYEVYTI